MKNQGTPPPAVELLEDRALLSTIVFDAEPNSRPSLARSFEFSSDQSARLIGTSTSSRDKDFFRFTAPTTGLLNFGVAGRSARLQIRDATGASLFDADPRDGVRNGTMMVTAGQTYLIGIQAMRNRPTPYTADLFFTSNLGVTLTQNNDLPMEQFAGVSGLTNLPAPPVVPTPTPPPSGGGETTPPPTGGGETPPAPTPTPPPVEEPGNELSETEDNGRPDLATDFNLGRDDTIRLLGAVADADIDFFTFQPRLPGQLQLNVQTEGGPVEVQVLDRDGMKLFEMGSGTDSVSVSTKTIDNNQPYYLRIQSASEASVSYSVDVNVIGFSK